MSVNRICIGFSGPLTGQKFLSVPLSLKIIKHISFQIAYSGFLSKMTVHCLCIVHYSSYNTFKLVNFNFTYYLILKYRKIRRLKCKKVKVHCILLPKQFTEFESILELTVFHNSDQLYFSLTIIGT